jgi:predicted GNAT family acetyltransferase
MTDPFDALTSFQKGFNERELPLQREESNRDLFEMRLTYARVQRKYVTALAIGVLTEPIEGISCFQLGVAVPEAYRGHGFAKNMVEAAIAEMRSGFARNNIPSFPWRRLSAPITSHPDGLRWRLARTRRKK